jgi:hypothetical protein
MNFYLLFYQYIGGGQKNTEHQAELTHRAILGQLPRAYREPKTMTTSDYDYLPSRMKAEGVTPRPPRALDEALEVTENRRASYGSPLADYTRTAKLWSVILGHAVTPDQAIRCMIAMKLSRLSSTPAHRDSVVDIIGYADCLDSVLQETNSGSYE